MYDGFCWSMHVINDTTDWHHDLQMQQAEPHQLVLTQSKYAWYRPPWGVILYHQGAVKVQSWADFCLWPRVHSVGVHCTNGKVSGLLLNDQLRVRVQYMDFATQTLQMKAHHPHAINCILKLCAKYAHKVTAKGEFTSYSYEWQIYETIY